MGIKDTETRRTLSSQSWMKTRAALFCALFCWVWQDVGRWTEAATWSPLQLTMTSSHLLPDAPNDGWLRAATHPFLSQSQQGRRAEPVQPPVLTFWHKIRSCHLPSASAVAPGAFQTPLPASASPEWRSAGHRVSRTDLLKCLIHYWQDKNEKTRVTHWPTVLQKLTQEQGGDWKA